MVANVPRVGTWPYRTSPEQSGESANSRQRVREGEGDDILCICQVLHTQVCNNCTIRTLCMAVPPTRKLWTACLESWWRKTTPRMYICFAPPLKSIEPTFRSSRPPP